jgi:hypothetical protein
VEPALASTSDPGPDTQRVGSRGPSSPPPPSLVQQAGSPVAKWPKNERSSGGKYRPMTFPVPLGPAGGAKRRPRAGERRGGAAVVLAATRSEGVSYGARPESRAHRAQPPALRANRTRRGSPGVCAGEGDGSCGVATAAPLSRYAPGALLPRNPRRRRGGAGQGQSGKAPKEWAGGRHGPKLSVQFAIGTGLAERSTSTSVGGPSRGGSCEQSVDDRSCLGWKVGTVRADGLGGTGDAGAQQVAAIGRIVGHPAGQDLIEHHPRGVEVGLGTCGALLPAHHTAEPPSRGPPLQKGCSPPARTGRLDVPVWSLFDATSPDSGVCGGSRGL